ncbi:MAG: PilZ domain-containing protein [Spirochaetales bacterium]|nr:PilZ domain-containing protein [Spirochaetales bacterium]MBR2317202.1 PilZ domain-containing protein [Spirochaetales bacterium]
MSEELRTERRVSVEMVPEDLREFNFSAGLFHEKQAELANLSKGGISFLTDDVDNHYEIGQKLKIMFSSRKIKLSGKIVYVYRVNDTKMKIGMFLSPSAELDEIKEIIDNISE